MLSRLLGSWRVLLPVLSFGLIGMCWVLSTPLSAGIDESSHFARVIGLSSGTLIGDAVPPDRVFSDTLTPRQNARVNAEAGIVEMRAPLSVPDGCNGLTTTMPYSCPQPTPTTVVTRVISDHAHTLPGAYFLPALASLAGSTTLRAMLLARAAFLLQDLALMTVVAFALRRVVRTPTTAVMATIALCVTPLLAFQSGTLSPNGTEIWSTLAFAGALLAAVASRSSRWWWSAVVCGIVACWSRDLGLAYVVAFAVAVAIAKPAMLPWLWSRRRSADVVGAVLLAIAGVGALIWQAALKSPLGTDWGGPSQWWTGIGEAVRMLRESIGLLGWLSVPIDPTLDALWALAWIAGVAALVIGADRRARLAAAALGAFYFAFTLFLQAGLRPTGFGLQARYTVAIPIAVVIVLASGQREVVEAPGRASSSLLVRVRWVLALTCLLVALGHLSGLLLSAEHNATGITGAPMDFTNVAWAPPGGWPLMFGLFGIACASVLVLPLAALRPRVVTSTAVPDGDVELVGRQPVA